MSKERLTEKLQLYAKVYKESPYGREVEGTVELLEEAAEKLAEYETLEEQGLLLRLPCNEGNVVWELCKCDDDVYRIFPMTVKQIAQYGSIRLVKGNEPTVWNIYAESDYTYMYKSFYDIGKTVFLTQSEAEEKLRELEGEVG